MGKLREKERRKQQAVDKEWITNTGMVRRLEGTAGVDFLYRKVWCLKSEVQCLNWMIFQK